MKPTKEEISLCKQVAEKHKRFPRKGDWEYNDNTKEATLRKYEYFGMENPIADEVNIFLIWTISDCLEFLREGGFTIVQACEHPMSNEWIIEVNPYFSNAIKIMGDKSFDVRGDTILEACLKAVLAVLEMPNG